MPNESQNPIKRGHEGEGTRFSKKQRLEGGAAAAAITPAEKERLDSELNKTLNKFPVDLTITIAAKLITQGANPNLQNKYRETALHWAAIRKNAAITRLLLGAGANPNLQDKDGKTALHCAAIFNNPVITRILLKAGADPSIKENNDQTPYDVAPAGAADDGVRAAIESAQLAAPLIGAIL